MTAKTRTNFQTDQATAFADNTAGDISAADLRGEMVHLSDSATFPEDLAATPAIGTPSSLTLTNATGLPIGGIASWPAGVTVTEVGYLDGVTSAIQTQINGKDAWGDAVDADIVPDADGTRDLGSSANRFAEVHTDSLDLNGTTVTTIVEQGSVSAKATPVAADRIIGFNSEASEAYCTYTYAQLATDTTNVTAAGALMDSELTSLSGVKTLTVPDSTTISTFGATLIDDADQATAQATLGVVPGTHVQAYDADTLKADTADTLTAGFNATDHSAGTKSTGTYTPDPADGNFQYAVNGGAHTLAPPGSSCTIVIQYTNNGSAGAITTSGFTQVTGDAFTTTDGDDFMCVLTRCNSFSVLNITALQ